MGNENVQNWRKTKRGLITNLYSKMKGRNKVDFDLEYLHEFSKCVKFDRLFNEWENSGYKKDFKPTIDRINNKQHYHEKNIQWLSWKDNRHKQTMERRCRAYPVSMLKDGIEMCVFSSQREAVLKTGLRQSGISACLNGNYKTCGGYQFKYVIGNIHNK